MSCSHCRHNQQFTPVKPLHYTEINSAKFIEIESKISSLNNTSSTKYNIGLILGIALSTLGLVGALFLAAMFEPPLLVLGALVLVLSGCEVTKSFTRWADADERMARILERSLYSNEASPSQQTLQLVGREQNGEWVETEKTDP